MPISTIGSLSAFDDPIDTADRLHDGFMRLDEHLPVLGSYDLAEFDDLFVNCRVGDLHPWALFDPDQGVADGFQRLRHIGKRRAVVGRAIGQRAEMIDKSAQADDLSAKFFEGLSRVGIDDVVIDLLCHSGSLAAKAATTREAEPFLEVVRQ